MNSSFGTRRQCLLWVSLLWVWSAVTAQDTTAPVAVTEPPTQPPAGSGWQGCEDPVNGKKLVTIGEPTTICLNIADGDDWTTARTYIRVNFQPIADQYSRFHVPSCK